MTPEQVRLAAISEEFTDSEVERMLMETVISEQSDLDDILSTLSRHRPVLIKRLNHRLGLS